MQNLKRVIIVVTLLAAVSMATAAWAHHDSAVQVLHSDNAAQGWRGSTNQQLTETLNWPEAGLTLPYPAAWELVGSQGFDFVLLGPSAEAGDVFIGLQSGLYDSRNQTLEDVMTTVAGELADALEATTLDGLEAWQFEFVNDPQQALIVGFITNPGQVNLLIMSAPTVMWEEWSTTYQEILETLSLSPLELDYELLNSQMQENLETHGQIIIGDPNAELQFVEFFDFSCGHCATFSPSVSRLVHDYTQDGQISVYLAILTGVGGEYSRTATQAQYCGTLLGAGWDMHELIFEEYATKGAREAYTSSNLTEAITNAEMDIDMSAFETCMEGSPGFDEFLQTNVTFANEYGVTATPTIFLGTEGELEQLQSRALMVIYEQVDNLLQ